MKCRHKFIHLRTDTWLNKYRYVNSYFLIDYFYCEKCLEEKTVEKSACDVSIYKDAPDWAIGITRVRKSE